MSCWPPAPEPNTTPTSSRFESSISKPESVTACLAAATPYWRLISVRRIDFASSHSSGSKSRTSPAVFASYRLTSKRVISPRPLRPWSRLSHTVCLSLPTGLMTPSPVTATRRV